MMQIPLSLVSHNPGVLCRPLQRQLGCTITPLTPEQVTAAAPPGVLLWDVGDAALQPPPDASPTGQCVIGLRPPVLEAALLHPWLLSGHVWDVPLPLQGDWRGRLQRVLAQTATGQPTVTLGDRLAHAWRLREALNQHLPYLRVGATPLTHAVWRFGQVLGLDDAGCVELVVGALVMDAPLLTQSPAPLLAPTPLSLHTGQALEASRGAFRHRPPAWLQPWPIALSVVRDRHVPAPQASLWARAVAIVDSYVALCSPRPFRAACSPGEALAEMDRHVGEQFDGSLLACFRDAIAPHPLLTPPSGLGPWMSRALDAAPVLAA